MFHLCSLVFYLCSLVFHLCSTCVHLCSTCVHLYSFVFHLCSFVFHLCSFVFICVYFMIKTFQVRLFCEIFLIGMILVFPVAVFSFSLCRKPDCSYFICVPLVFTCVHLCSTCVHLCSFVFTCVPNCVVFSRHLRLNRK